ncbi:MAG: hypothetical protein ACXVHR_10945, partial [Methanobacterium sp.]
MKFFIPIILISLTLLLCLNTSSASFIYPDTVYVNGSSGNDSNNGTSWEYAKASIQSGINNVNNNGTINVANGIY